MAVVKVRAGLGVASAALESGARCHAQSLVRPIAALLAALLSLLALSACGQKIEAPLYTNDDCRRVRLIDAETGDPVRGAEDIAVDRERARLIVSAYDRRKAESAARRGAPHVPEGGLYSVDLAALESGEEAKAKPLVERFAIEGGLRPHGLSLDPKTGEVAFINRSYVQRGRAWRMHPTYFIVSSAGEVLDFGAAHCAANDILLGARIYASFDHASCVNAGVEDVTGGGQTGIVDLDGKSVFVDARYANGLARKDAETFALAATREKAVLLFEEKPGVFSMTTRIRTPGGPDNLDYAVDGRIIAAVHPDMMRLFFARKLGLGRAPSRAIAIDPKSEKVRVLFDDPSGRLFSAATAAVVEDGALILGSALDEGLLVCKSAR